MAKCVFAADKRNLIFLKNTLQSYKNCVYVYRGSLSFYVTISFKRGHNVLGGQAESIGNIACYKNMLDKANPVSLFLPK